MAGQTTHLHLRHRGIIPSTQLGSGFASASNFLRGDQQWSDRYVHAITSSSSNSFIGQVDFRAGTGAALSASSNTITISATGGGGGGAPTDADYLVGTANATLTNEIVVGATPGGELGGTWTSPTVDATHSGSAHHTQAHVTLSADHSDTLAGTIVRGDLIRGNATPKWERLPISGSSPSNAVLVNDGTDAYWRWPSPVDRVTASSSNVFWGQVDFRAGANTALAVSSNTITISASGGGGGGGGGGGAGVSWTKADEAPTGPHASDIEFDATTLTGWTVQASTATIQNQTLGEWQDALTPTDPQWNANTDIPSALVMQSEAGTNGIKAYRSFAPTSATRWAVMCKARLDVVVHGGVSNSPQARLFVENTTPTASQREPTDGIVVDLSYTTAGWEVRSFSMNNGSAANIITVRGDSTMYLAIVGETDNGITAYCSNDGLGWRRMFKYTGLDINGAVSHVAITAGQDNSGDLAIGIYEFVRFLEGSGNLWDLGAGN